MIANPRFHCWRHAKRLVNSAKIVVHVMQSDRRFQIRDLLGEPISQPSKPAHGHPHREVLALNVARGNVVEVGVAADYRLARSHADSGAVAHLWTLWRSAVNLLKLRVINLRSENFIDRVQIRSVSVRCQLDAMQQTFLQIGKEMICATGVALADEPAGNQFRIRVERNPRPDIASALHFVLARAVLFFRVNKAPYFVALDSFAAKIAKRFVLIVRADTAKIAEQIHNRRAMHARHSGNGAKGISFDQCRHHLFSLFKAQLVHASNMLERSSIVNKKR